MGVDPDKVVPDPERSIRRRRGRPLAGGSKSWRMKMVETLAKAMEFSLVDALEQAAGGRQAT